MIRAIMIFAVLACLIVSVNVFSVSGDTVKERFQESDIQSLKENLTKLEKRIVHLEKRIITLEKQQMKKEMHEGYEKGTNR